MPPRRRKTLSSPSSTVDSVPMTTAEQSLRSTPATSESDSVKLAPRRSTRSRYSMKGPKKRVRESSDEEDPLAMEEDEEVPLQKVAKRATKRRATTSHASVEITVKEKPTTLVPATLVNKANRSEQLKSLAQTRKPLPRASKSATVSSTPMTDDNQEEYLTSNSLGYEEESDSGSEFEQASDEGSVTMYDVDSDEDKSLPPFRPALKKSKSRQSMASSEAVDQEELEQAMFEAAIKQSRQTAVQDRKLGQSSRYAGSSRAAAPPLPDFDDGNLSELSDGEIPLSKGKTRGKGKGKGKEMTDFDDGNLSELSDGKIPLSRGKTRGKGKEMTDWDDSDAESESLELAGEFDAPELTKKERKALAESNDPVKIHQRAMARKLGRKLTHAERTSVALHLHHPELRNVWGDLERRPPVEAREKAAQPPGLKVKLLPFQQDSLFWMRKQEKYSEWKGGVLADEMGMGKTIQTLALLVSDPRKPNLVVAPTVAIMQWKNEIEAHTEGLKVCVFHGATRTKEVKELKSFDVVLTTYAVLESSYRKQHSGFKRKGQMVKEASPLHAFKWARTILDEAHNIKERSCNTAKGAFELQSEYKWCLSGTPLQNRVGELYSLIRFLGGDPFAYYFCKQCDCKSLHWSFSDKKSCDKCKHSPMNHVCLWNNEILGPIQKNAFSGPGEIAFKKLRVLLDRVMLRRTKLECADELGLPPRTVIVRRDYFSPEEKELYLSLFTDAKRQFSTYVEKGTLLNNYSNIFSLITRMRQMACHPDLVLKSKTNPHFSADVVEATVCRLCNDIAEDAIESRCHHIFDRECIKQYCEAASGRDPDCPVCHIPLSINLEAEALELAEDAVNKARQGILGRLELDTWRSSSKIEALVEELSNLRKQDCTTKSIVFSQFVNFLDLIAYRLKRAGFNLCRLEGTMSPQARDATIKHFMNNVDVTVFLVSLKAGGVALNLTEASRVYLMDSWWNPAVEYQAMDRIHRLGQHRPVQAIKLVIEDSIESRIVQLQEKKSAMVDATLSTDDSAMGRLTPEDLGFLFRL